MARAPQQAPQPLESPAVRRSRYLSELLQQTRQAPQIQSGGELAARLLAQGVAQFGANRAEGAAQEEITANRTRDIARYGSMLGIGEPAPQAAGLANALVPTIAPEGPGNTLTPTASSVAPIAPIEASPLPPAAPPAPSQQAMFALAPNERAYAEQLRQAGDLEGLQQLFETVQGRNLSPDIQVGPDGVPFNASDPNSLNRTFANREFQNGFLVNTNDPANEGRYFPDFQPGEEPVYNQAGDLVGVRNMAGAIQALGDRTQAVSDAQNASEASYAGVRQAAVSQAEAPYKFVVVQGSDGQPITMSVAQAAGGAFEGQSRADAERDVVAARGAGEADVEAARRLREAPARLERYDEALDLLPSAITGFAAEQRLLAARALAATGNRDAAREVAATEVYQNLVNRDLGSLIREIVGNAQISNTDREFAQRVNGGDISLNPQTLTRILTIARDGQQRVLDSAQPSQSAPQVIYDPQGRPYVVRNGQWVPQ